MKKVLGDAVPADSPPRSLSLRPSDWLRHSPVSLSQAGVLHPPRRQAGSPIFGRWRSLQTGDTPPAMTAHLRPVAPAGRVSGLVGFASNLKSLGHFQGKLFLLLRIKYRL